MSRPYKNGMYKVTVDQTNKVFDSAYRVEDIKIGVQSKSNKNQPLNRVEVEYCKRNNIQMRYVPSNNSYYVNKK